MSDDKPPSDSMMLLLVHPMRGGALLALTPALGTGWLGFFHCCCA